MFPSRAGLQRPKRYRTSAAQEDLQVRRAGHARRGYPQDQAHPHHQPEQPDGHLHRRCDLIKFCELGSRSASTRPTSTTTRRSRPKSTASRSTRTSSSRTPSQRLSGLAGVRLVTSSPRRKWSRSTAGAQGQVASRWPPWAIPTPRFRTRSRCTTAAVGRFRQRTGQGQPDLRVAGRPARRRGRALRPTNHPGGTELPQCHQGQHGAPTATCPRWTSTQRYTGAARRRAVLTCEPASKLPMAPDTISCFDSKQGEDAAVSRSFLRDRASRRCW